MAAPDPPQRAPQVPGKVRSNAAIRKELERAELEFSLVETRYTTGLLSQLMSSEKRLQEAQFIMAEPDEGNWDQITSGTNLTTQKTLGEQRDPATLRRQMYRFWRFHPHARGILRNFVRFILGSGFTLDYDDPETGEWADAKKTALKAVSSKKKGAMPMVSLVWEDFVERTLFKQRAKEIVLRAFRDGECFVRRFKNKGRVILRIIEPERVVNAGGGLGGSVAEAGQVQKGDLEDDDQYVGKPTRVSQGIEYLETDIETVVAYHIQVGAGDTKKHERVPAADMIHVKALADMNDLRGIPTLEVVAKRLANYDQWEEYRMILNKMRTAIALVRKVTGTSSQAEAIIQGRMSPRSEPRRMEPQTGSGRREAMFKPGTTLTPSPGVEYQFISPNLEARDASEDGRRFLMSIAAGVGLPEMLVTGDWSNSNFASSVEARTPAVREWEDWQDFFEPHFKRIYRWVIEEAIEGLGLPEETSRDVTIQWPQLIAKDSFRETERLMNLWASGVMSKQTWAALEDLDYDAEQANIVEEMDDVAAQGQALALAAAANGLPMGAQPPGTPPAGTGRAGQGAGAQGGGLNILTMRPRPTVGGKAGPPPPPKSGQNPYVAEAVEEYAQSLATLQEEVDAIEDPLIHAAMDRYMAAANRALIVATPPRRNGHAPTARRRPARPRR